MPSFCAFCLLCLRPPSSLLPFRLHMALFKLLVHFGKRNFVDFASSGEIETKLRNIYSKPMPPCETLSYRVHESKDEHFITQKDIQPSQTCSGGFIKTQLRAIRCCFFAIGEYNLIKFNLFAQRHKYDHLDRPRGAGIRRLTGREEKQSSAN